MVGLNSPAVAENVDLTAIPGGRGSCRASSPTFRINSSDPQERRPPVFRQSQARDHRNYGEPQFRTLSVALSDTGDDRLSQHCAEQGRAVESLSIRRTVRNMTAMPDTLIGAACRAALRGLPRPQRTLQARVSRVSHLYVAQVRLRRKSFPAERTYNYRCTSGSRMSRRCYNSAQ